MATASPWQSGSSSHGREPARPHQALSESQPERLYVIRPGHPSGPRLSADGFTDLGFKKPTAASLPVAEHTAFAKEQCQSHDGPDVYKSAEWRHTLGLARGPLLRSRHDAANDPLYQERSCARCISSLWRRHHRSCLGTRLHFAFRGLVERTGPCSLVESPSASPHELSFSTSAERAYRIALTSSPTWTPAWTTCAQ